MRDLLPVVQCFLHNPLPVSVWLGRYLRAPFYGRVEAIGHAADAAWGCNPRCYRRFRGTLAGSYLIFHMTLENQHVHHRQLLHESMPLELLPYFSPKRGDGHIEGVHLLDFGGLWSWHVSTFALIRRGAHPRVLTARSHSRYDVITLRLASCQFTA